MRLLLLDPDVTDVIRRGTHPSHTGQSRPSHLTKVAGAGYRRIRSVPD